MSHVNLFCIRQVSACQSVIRLPNIEQVFYMATRFQRFHKKLKSFGFNSYNEYLESDHWKELKKRYWASKSPKYCIVCKKIDFVPIFHHRTYKNLGNERLMDLVLVCRDCHRIIHDNFNKNFSVKPRSTNIWKTTKLVARKGGADYPPTRNGFGNAARSYQLIQTHL